MELDEALRQAKEASNSKPETNTQVNQPATDEPKVEGVSDFADKGGDKVDDTPPEAGKAEGVQQTQDDKPDDGKDKTPKFSKKERARFAFAKLTSKNADLKGKLDKVMAYLEQAKGVKYDPNSMKLEDYLALHDEVKEAEKLKTQLSNDLNAPNNDLRLEQADAIWENDAKAVEEYKNVVLPHIAEINKILMQKAPVVARFVAASENAPILEKAFLGNEGISWLNYVNTNDDMATWNRCQKMESDLLAKIQTPKPVAPTQSRATGKVASAPTKGEGAPINAPSLDHIRKMLRG